MDSGRPARPDVRLHGFVLMVTKANRSYDSWVSGYGAKKARFPLKTYIGFVAAYNLLLAGMTIGDGVDFSIEDLAFLGVATHKLSRILTKDVVTSPIRAPFTKYQELLGYGEVQEEGRGSGAWEVFGELLSCNYCADPWVAIGFTLLHRFFPAKSRFLTRFFSAVALADFLHVHYEMNRSRENVLTLREEKLEKTQSKSA